MYQNISGTFNLAVDIDLNILNTKKLYLQCQTGTAATNIILPRISTLTNGAGWGFEIYVNDFNNLSATNNITIIQNAADTVNGLSLPIIIATNGMVGRFEIIGTNKWLFSTSKTGETTSSLVNVAVNYQITAIDFTSFTVNVTANSPTITLPTAIGIQGNIYIIKNSGNGLVTLNTLLGQTIDNQLTQLIEYPNSISVQSNNTNYIII